MLICKYIYCGATIGVCKIDDNIEAFIPLLSKENIESVTSTTKNSTRIKEKLAIRILLKEILGEEVSLEYDKQGKPLIRNNKINISISHTHGFAAVILDNQKKIGIDIERISDKIIRVQDKFINTKECIDQTHKIIHLLIHWCAKESIYKAVSESDINLKEDIVIDQFIPSYRGFVNAHCRSESFQIHYEVLEKYVLAIATIKE